LHFISPTKYLYFRFPKDKKRRRAWAKAVKRKKWRPSDSSTLCSDHFTEENYVRLEGRKLLKKDAIPTVFNLPTRFHKHVTPRKLPKARNTEM